MDSNFGAMSHLSALGRRSCFTGLDRYERLEQIGEGAYGVVYRVRDKATGQIVALKKIRLDSQSTEGVPQSALREILMLRELNHPNIVRLQDVVLQDRKLHLVFEYLKQDLRQHLDNCKEVPHMVVKSFLKQLLKGVFFCHTHRVIHRDLKPQNLLLDEHGRLKIADFGLRYEGPSFIHSFIHSFFLSFLLSLSHTRCLPL
ncbi:MAG TPA: protein kinase, partial [Oculatellaceae cyanobacterium]